MAYGNPSAAEAELQRLHVRRTYLESAKDVLADTANLVRSQADHVSQVSRQIGLAVGVPDKLAQWVRRMEELVRALEREVANVKGDLMQVDRQRDALERR